MGFDPLAQAVNIVSDGQRRPGEHLQLSQGGIALGLTRGQRLPPHVLCFLRQEEDGLPPFGDLSGQFDVLGPQRREQHRNAFADRMIDELERLTQSAALAGGQWNRVDLLDARRRSPIIAETLSLGTSQ